MAIDKRYFAQFPFIQEAMGYVSQSRGMGDIEGYLKSDMGKAAVDKAKERILGLVNGDLVPSNIQYGLRPPENEIEIYAIARMMVSCINNGYIIQKLVDHDVERAFYYFQILKNGTLDDPDIKPDHATLDEIAKKFNFNYSANEIPVIQYVPMIAGLHGAEWKLVNRNVVGGKVQLADREKDILFKNVVKKALLSKLPVAVPENICKRVRIGMACGQILEAAQKKMYEQFGEIEEGAYPPCIRSLMAAVNEGTNIPHMGRFALTCFLHTIGLSPDQIVELFVQSSGFDHDKTMYQVSHICGRAGTEYVCPACATLKTNSLCVNPDKICEKINHPLNYYKRKKWYEQKDKEKSGESNE